MSKITKTQIEAGQAVYLKKTSQRIKHYKPITKRVNVLEPINFEERGFDSIGLNYLLHCLPGTMSTIDLLTALL